MSLLYAYIDSVRPATLLLAIACALCGGALALFAGTFNTDVFILTLLTASSLQIISNLANDYGDYQQGTDNINHRVGPARALLKGEITLKHMKAMIVFSIAMTIFLGLSLLYVALSSEGIAYVLVFLLLGVSCIWAAIKYTAGKNPYGYKGLGDLFTFIFFGPVGFVGAYFLQTHRIDFIPWLPSIGYGLLTAIVINVNNMRDLTNDTVAGKVTIPIVLGAKNSRHYHAALTLLAFVCFLIFNLIYLAHWYQHLYMLMFVVLFKFVADIYKIKEEIKLAPYLKRTVLTAFTLSVAFSICINL